jgi:large subunit ribosomal protein L29
MNATELRELDADELITKLAEAKAELFNLRFQLATNQLDNTARLREMRTEVARIATVIRELEISEWRAIQTPDARRQTPGLSTDDRGWAAGNLFDGLDARCLWGRRHGDHLQFGSHHDRRTDDPTYNHDHLGNRVVGLGGRGGGPGGRVCAGAV